MAFENIFDSTRTALFLLWNSGYTDLPYTILILVYVIKMDDTSIYHVWKYDWLWLHVYNLITYTKMIISYGK